MQCLDPFVAFARRHPSVAHLCDRRSVERVLPALNVGNQLRLVVLLNQVVQFGWNVDRLVHLAAAAAHRHICSRSIKHRLAELGRCGENLHRPIDRLLVGLLARLWKRLEALFDFLHENSGVSQALAGKRDIGALVGVLEGLGQLHCSAVPRRDKFHAAVRGSLFFFLLHRKQCASLVLGSLLDLSCVFSHRLRLSLALHALLQHVKQLILDALDMKGDDGPMGREDRRLAIQLSP